MWHSHNFLLPCISVKEYFIIKARYIFNLNCLCFVDDELSTFLFAAYNFLPYYPYVALVRLYSSNFYLQMIHFAYQVKMWGMKKILWQLIKNMDRI